MRALLLSSLVLLLAGCATQTVTSDGLVSQPSSGLDEFYVRPNAGLPAYRSVMIGPVAVQFRGDWLKQEHAYNRIQYPARSSGTYQDAETLSKDMSELMHAELVAAFTRRGYQIVDAPGPGVLQVSATISDLFINAPDRLSSSLQASASREVGQATLSLEARDPNRVVVARVVHKAIARQATRSSLASDGNNRLWLDATFRRWAENCAVELGGPRTAQASLRN